MHLPGPPSASVPHLLQLETLLIEILSPCIKSARLYCGVHPCRKALAMHRRSQALKDLPGPTYPFLPGMMLALVCRRDPHRYATELAEKYGPIFKFRLLIFHVRTLSPAPETVL